MTILFHVLIFGLIGILCRYFLDQAFPVGVGEFPLTTFLINLFGSFAIGIVYVLGSETTFISDHLRTGLTVGLLGGLTTFSAFSLQSFLLIQNKDFFKMLIYLIGSPTLGVLFAWLGVFLTRKLI